MKKILSCGLLGIFVFGLMVSPGLSQDANKILEKVIDAQGGRKLLESIKDSTSTATLEMVQMGMSATGTMYTKEPNKMRMDLEIMGMVMTQAFDGETAWMINLQTGVTEEMPEELADLTAKGAYGNAAFLDPKKYGLTYNLKGKEEIEGKEYLPLERVYSDGYTITFYIDSKTYLIYKTKAKSLDDMMSEIVEEAIFSDYKKVGGMMTAHSITILRDGEEFVVLTITEVANNTGLEDSLFEMEKINLPH